VSGLAGPPCRPGRPWRLGTPRRADTAAAATSPRRSRSCSACVSVSSTLPALKTGYYQCSTRKRQAPSLTSTVTRMLQTTTTNESDAWWARLKSDDVSCSAVPAGNTNVIQNSIKSKVPNPTNLRLYWNWAECRWFPSVSTPVYLPDFRCLLKTTTPKRFIHTWIIYIADQTMLPRYQMWTV